MRAAAAAPAPSLLTPGLFTAAASLAAGWSLAAVLDSFGVGGEEEEPDEEAEETTRSTTMTMMMTLMTTPLTSEKG